MMNTLDFLLDKYSPTKEPLIEVYNSRTGTLMRIFRDLDFKLGAEVGVAKGYFSKFLCEHIPHLKLYSIDAWEVWPGATHGETQKSFEELYRAAKKRLDPFQCHIIRDWSMSAVNRFADESLDFVYIDAAHDYNAVYQDIREWSKKVRKGGIVSGHDYISPTEVLNKSNYTKDDFNDTNYGVKKAVDDFVKENKITHLFVFTKDFAPSWFYVK